MSSTTPFSVALDASRNRSGGAVAHLVGLIRSAEPERYGVSRVHVWSYRALLEALPDKPWLVRHNPTELERGILAQLAWQRWKFPGEIREAGCDIVFNTDAGSLGRFQPAVTLSQDMLSYEAGELARFSWNRSRARVWLLRYIQNRSLRHADSAIFLTRYQAAVIQRSCGALRSVAVIPHGVDDEFRNIGSPDAWPAGNECEIRCVYVSPTAYYKHQWQVVKAVERLRKDGVPITLTLIGGGNGPQQARLDEQVNTSDPSRKYIFQMPFLRAAQVRDFLKQAHVFIFASSCEAIGVTLLEGMAAGLPIACSNRGPMPEVLRDGGFYFDPEDDRSIADAIRAILADPDSRRRTVARSTSYAAEFTWERCAHETFTHIARVHRREA